MKRKMFILAVLAAVLLLSMPLSAAADANDYEARIVSVKAAAQDLYPDVDGYEILTAGAYSAAALADEASGTLQSVTIKYGEATVYESARASNVIAFPESVYLYEEGALKHFANGEVKEVLKVDAGLTLAYLSESGGIVYAYFMDTPARDLYVYNLSDGSMAKGNVGELPVITTRIMSYADSDNWITRAGDYFRITRQNPATGENSETLLKQEGGELTRFEPDVSEVPNANPEGKALIPFYYNYEYGYGYLDETGKVAALCGYATPFLYNEDGAGVAFVSNGVEGYFIDQYLNKVSVTIPSYEAFCYANGVFDVYTDEAFENCTSFGVELVPKGSEYTDIFGIMRPMEYLPVWALGGTRAD